MPPEALVFDSEHFRAWKELYEVPGGDQVEGSPPVPVSRIPARGEAKNSLSFAQLDARSGRVLVELVGIDELEQLQRRAELARLEQKGRTFTTKTWGNQHNSDTKKINSRRAR
eukprot:3009466-Pyramimonas_sp.AAC.1